MERVLVVGAGLAGLTCARELAGAGWSVTVVDKGRSPGGRLATRRRDDGAHFDHGAQYFTARSAEFRAQLERWLASGTAEHWQPRITVLGDGDEPRQSDTERFVGVPGMSALAGHLAAELAQSGATIHSAQRVARVARTGALWSARDDSGGALGEFDRVVLACPPQNVADVLGEHELAMRAAAARMRPCLAVLARFEQPLELPFDAAFVHDSQLAWAARNASKPGRPDAAEAWVLHGSPEWSERHLETQPADVERNLLAAFAIAIGSNLPAADTTSHRWRYALPDPPLSEPYLLAEGGRLGACGDWCDGPRVEGAYLSGLRLAGALLSGRAHGQTVGSPANNGTSAE